MDILIVVPATIVLSPVLAVLGLVVGLTMGWPILFRQARSGRGGKSFDVCKFRTMTNARGPGGELLPDSARLTRVGRVMRRWSLDELPELATVLRGDMSLIGPRPLLERYRTRYTPEQARRLEIRPGITGWAQIKGRNALSWEERFQLDTWYVDHLGFLLDLSILLRTIGSVLRPEGITASGHASMPEFFGERPRRP